MTSQIDHSTRRRVLAGVIGGLCALPVILGGLGAIGNAGAAEQVTQSPGVRSTGDRSTGDRSTGDRAPLEVFATVSMVGDAVSQIAGDRAKVTTLMGEGIDPHAYRQTRSDVVRLGRADLIFANGLYLEAQLETLLHKLAAQKPVTFIGDGLPAQKLLSHDTYSAKFDPHIWMDPELWGEAILAIRDALIAADPDGRTIYASNTERYQAELANLSHYARKALASVPSERRILITAHDAFNYFGRAYDFDVVGIQGISTESEAGLRQIETVVDLIVAKDVPAVFIESSVSPRNIKALIEGAKVRGSRVQIGGLLYSDSMGRPGTYEGTYIGMIDHNITRITRALGGTAPERGMNNKLFVGG